MSNHDSSRRKFIKAAVYTAPVIMTLKAAPAMATSGSNISRCGSEEGSLRCKIGSQVNEVFNQSQSSGGGFASFIKSLLKIFGL